MQSLTGITEISKKDFVHIMDEVYQKSQSIRFLGDKENANTDSTLVATKRCLIFNELNKQTVPQVLYDQ